MHILFDDDSPLGAAYAAVDWESSPVGPVGSWSPTLRNAVDLVLRTRFPITLLWGPDLSLVYNQAYVPLIADKHPAALGRPAREVFPEAWDTIGPLLRQVLDGGEAVWFRNAYMPLVRRGFLEECHFTYAYSAVRNAQGEVEGVMDIVEETTAQVLAARRMALLSRLNERLADLGSIEEVTRSVLPLLRAQPEDFADVALATGPGDPRQESPDVMRFPLSADGDGVGPDGWQLVVRLSPTLAADGDYLQFLELVAASLRQASDRVRAGVAERRVLDVQQGMATAFQRSLLPVPQPPGDLGLEARYQPAVELAQVGGDWYDWFSLPDDVLVLVIGDVAGHDQDAAAAMAQVRNMVRGVAPLLHPASPADVLAGLDRSMTTTAVDVVATAVLAQVHRDDDGLSLCWSNAGHPPPALLGSDGSVELLDRDPDLLLGVDPTLPRRHHRARLHEGCSVVFYTDGLVERRGRPISDGLTWMQDTLRDRQHLTPAQLCDHLLASTRLLEDDVALLVLRV